MSATLDEVELRTLDGWWRACNYLAAGMIYLRDNALLEAPLAAAHVKERLLGHWGSSPGLSFIYAHLNRLIRRHDLDMIFITGPGHGAPGVLAPAYLEGTYGEVYPETAKGVDGLTLFLRQFSFPGGIGSHCTPALPGSIHEGGELGYSLSHAFGAAFDNPGLIVAVTIGDGEAETGALATAWHSNKFLNPVRDGTVLPILHLNGYKIANPAVLARIPAAELDALIRGYGWTSHFVEGREPMAMHAAMAATLERCLAEIRDIRRQARDAREVQRPRWPAIVLRTPKGWTGPAEVDGHAVEGSWRSHQVPLPAARDDPTQRALLEQWLRSYRPQELFDASGRLRQPFAAAAPTGRRRMSANPHANGGLLRRSLDLPAIGDYGVAIPEPGTTETWNTRPLGRYLRDVMRRNPDNFRVFGPDETASNRLEAVLEAGGKAWMADLLPTDADGGALSRDGRVMEVLSEHTLEGWLEGYLLTGRHGFFATYEAFAHVIGSMFNQHAKWLDSSQDVAWRAPVPSLNILITSTVWRQDHNGFTHQDPGFIDLVVNKSPRVTRVHLPPDANSLLVTVEQCLRSTNRINVIVADKQQHLQYLDVAAAARHLEAGASRWAWASSDDDGEPDAVLAACGDVATHEALAAAALLRELVPNLRLRFLNVSNLHVMTQASEHPDGLADAQFDELFTRDRPIIFSFHGYPWLIHRLAYRRTNHPRLHVRGYKEKGGINTPLELAILNEVDRFSLAIDVISRVPRMAGAGQPAIQHLRRRQAECVRHAHEHGVDDGALRGWRWQPLQGSGG